MSAEGQHGARHLIAAHLRCARSLLGGTEGNSEDERDWVHFCGGVALDLGEFALSVGEPRNAADLADDLRMLADVLDGAHAAAMWVRDNWRPGDG